MKKIVLSVIFLFSTFFSSAQAPVLEWAKGFGGTSSNNGKSIAVDLAGNVYTIGDFQDTSDLDPGVGIYNLTSSSGYTGIFISKLDVFGNFVWAKQIGGTSYNDGWDIVVDLSGNVYTIGDFQGTVDFDPGLGTYNLTAAIGYDIFISKLDAFGNFVWAKNLGGTTFNFGFSIVLDASENICATGVFNGTVDFDPGSGVFNLTSSGGYENVFVLKLDSFGNFMFAKQLGGTSDVESSSIAIDGIGNIYVTGYFYETIDFDPGLGVVNLTSSTASYTDIFVLKLDGFGNFVWAKRIGGTDDDFGYSIAVDMSGNVFTTGFFALTVDFDPNGGVYNLSSSAGFQNVFVSKLSSTGNFIWAQKFGGTSNSVGYSIFSDGYRNVYTTGCFGGTVDFDPNSGTSNLTANGITDVFISKLDSIGNFVWAKNIGGNSYNCGNSIDIDSLGNIYTTGNFYGTADFDPDLSISNLVSHFGNDAFVTKWGQTPTGIEGISNESNILIYPNPSNNFLEIETILTDYSLSVFDIMGNLVFDKKVNQNNTRIDVSDFSNGIYFLQLTSGDKLISKKFIKE